MKSIKLKGGDHSVLLFHGLSGTHVEMIYLAMSLNQAGYSVEIPYIEGYSFHPKVNSFTPSESWVEKSLEEFDRMKQEYKTVAVGGLCIGAILSLNIASMRPHSVDGLILLSPTLFMDGWRLPWYTKLIPFLYYTPLRYALYYKEEEPFGVKDLEVREHIKNNLLRKSYLKSTDSLIMPNISLYRLYQTQRLIRKVKKKLQHVTSSALIIHALEDDTASIKNAYYVKSNLGYSDTKLLELKDSYHNITVDREKEKVVSEVKTFVKSLHFNL